MIYRVWQSRRQPFNSCCRYRQLVLGIMLKFLWVATLLTRLKALHVVYSDGRRNIYLCGLPLLVVGSVGIYFCRDIPQLMIFRFLQAFGASPGLSVGSGVIGDIYKLEQRGTAMGVFFAVSADVHTSGRSELIIY